MDSLTDSRRFAIYGKDWRAAVEPLFPATASWMAVLVQARELLHDGTERHKPPNAQLMDRLRLRCEV